MHYSGEIILRMIKLEKENRMTTEIAEEQYSSVDRSESTDDISMLRSIIKRSVGENRKDFKLFVIDYVCGGEE